MGPDHLEPRNRKCVEASNAIVPSLKPCPFARRRSAVSRKSDAGDDFRTVGTSSGRSGYSPVANRAITTMFTTCIAPWNATA